MTLTWNKGDGLSLTIGDGRLHLVSVEGLDAPRRTLTITRGPTLDGPPAAIKAVSEPRRIRIEALLDLTNSSEAETIEQRMLILRALVPCEIPGILTVTRAGRQREIEACPTQTPLFSCRKRHEPWQIVTIELMCLRSYFRDTNTVTHTIRYYTTCLEFPEEGLEFTAEGLEIARVEHSGSRMSTILNEGNAPAPLHIRFTGPMTNPYICNRTTGQTVRIGHEIREGESLEINTEPGRRQIVLWQGNSSRNGMHYLDLSSSFFQLEPGENLVEIGDESPQEGSEAIFEYQSHYIEA